MAITNRERIGKALETLRMGLAPFIQQEMKTEFGDEWIDELTSGNTKKYQTSKDPNLRFSTRPDDSAKTKSKKSSNELIPNDVALLLAGMKNNWRLVFDKILGNAEKNLVFELLEVRNKWAHQESFTYDDTYRALDSMVRLLKSVSASEQASEIEKNAGEILRIKFSEQARTEQRKATEAAVVSTTVTGTKPWREIVTPHPDVASGNYIQAEFAADLAKVHQGGASTEYGNPNEFFERTYITDGLRRLLKNTLMRISGKGGDPVVELQTNFGGGKTHSMLAVYHLCSSVPIIELAGMEPLIQESEISTLPNVNRAVLVGSSLSPGMASKKKNGVSVNTLWGEMAWQLGGKKGYQLVAGADQSGVSPGADALEKLFQEYSPCLILIDEWVAYVRQVYNKSDLPAGSFDANFTFAQSLTEAIKRVPQALLLASIPSSDIEIGGEGGKEANERLKHIFNRVATSWHPANMEEGFEIVRRRLFQPLTSNQSFKERDAVIKTIIRFYRDQGSDFPNEVKEAEYEERMKAAYPIHPELFDRLYGGWSTLDKFQRTRGVLQLMAAVIHTLWERNDNAPLIYPATIPIDDGVIRDKLTYYLEDPWIPVIETDVDGPGSLPLRLDQDNPTLGRYSACRRVSRTIYMGSAPTIKTSQKGIDERNIKLGCVMPGESIATFGDALRRLSDNATHLYVDKQRYWYSTQPSVIRMAHDRARDLKEQEDSVHYELKKRLRNIGSKGPFAKVHSVPESPNEVPDDWEMRLVILGPENTHQRKTKNSAAMQYAQNLLEYKGSGPRQYRNMLVFLAPDHSRLNDLEEAISQYLAWESILNEKSELNLDTFSERQANTKKEQAEDSIKSRILETYVWLLVPSQTLENPKEIEWTDYRLQGTDALAVRAGKKLVNDGSLYETFAPALLRIELDKCLWGDENHVSVKKLWEYFATYLYLPRLQNQNLLVNAIQEGLASLTWQDNFAYADAYDESTDTYKGLTGGDHKTIILDGKSVLVKPEVAEKHLNKTEQVGTGGNIGGSGTTVKPDPPVNPTDPTPPPIPPKIKRFHGRIQLDSNRISPQSSKIADAIINHLIKNMNNKVEITLEIQAEIPDGASDQLIRTITENCNALNFEHHGFEED